jgi:hypothetical protein
MQRNEYEDKWEKQEIKYNISFLKQKGRDSWRPRGR